MTETRLITRDTRPDLYALLEDARAANDNRREFVHAYRRRHWFIAFLAWCAESNWRIAGLIGASFFLGCLLEAVLP